MHRLAFNVSTHSLKQSRGFVYGSRPPKSNSDPYVESVLEDFDPVLLNSIRGYSKKPLPSWLHEEEFLNKLSHAQNHLPPPNDERFMIAFTKAREIVEREFKVDKVAPITPEEALKTFTLDTSAGYSYYPLKKADVIERILPDTRNFIEEIVGLRPVVLPIAMIFSRGKLSPNQQRKGRTICANEFKQGMIEAMFLTPIMNQLKADPDHVMLFGSNMLYRLGNMCFRSYGRGTKAVRTDFKWFDIRCRKWVMNEALFIIEQNIDFNHWRGKRVSPSTSNRYRRLWQFIKYYTMNTVVMLPSGRIIQRCGGVSSGSHLTVLIDSIINRLYIETLCQYFGYEVIYKRALGDDGFTVITMPGDIDLNKWAWFFRWGFGAELSVEKTEVWSGNSPYKRFLGYEFHLGRLHLTTRDLFMKALYPEGEVDNVHKSLSRLVAYMMLGGVDDLKFSDFVQYFSTCFVIDYNQYIYVDKALYKKIKYIGGPMDLFKRRLCEINYFMLSFGPLSISKENK